jgi:hypothetical protein
MAAAAVRSGKAADLHNPAYEYRGKSAPEASAGDATAAVQVRSRQDIIQGTFCLCKQRWGS